MSCFAEWFYLLTGGRVKKKSIPKFLGRDNRGENSRKQYLYFSVDIRGQGKYFQGKHKNLEQINAIVEHEWGDMIWSQESMFPFSLEWCTILSILWAQRGETQEVWKYYTWLSQRRVIIDLANKSVRHTCCGNSRRAGEEVNVIQSIDTSSPPASNSQWQLKTLCTLRNGSCLNPWIIESRLRNMNIGISVNFNFPSIQLYQNRWCNKHTLLE